MKTHHTPESLTSTEVTTDQKILVGQTAIENTDNIVLGYN
jgi:hypothetical protein